MYKLFYSCLFILLMALFSCSKSNETELKAIGQGTSSTGCDTSDMKYSTDIAPILLSNCNSCHNATRPLGGAITDNYTSLKMIADNGLLVGTVTHASGFSPMPKGKPKLADCDINKLKAWVNQGTKNN